VGNFCIDVTLSYCWPPLSVQTTAPFRMPMSGT
jgi:hypothetical protein